MAERANLPERRELTRFASVFEGQRYAIDYACFSNGRVAEIFVTAEKTASAAEAIARDAAIVISIGLQHGVPPEALRKAMTRDARGEPLSIVGHALDAVAAETEFQDV